MSYDVVWESRGVLIRFSGVIDRAALMAAEERLWSDPRWSAIDYELWDLLGVTRSDVSRDEGVSMAYMDKAASISSGRNRIAFAVPSDLKLTGLPAYVEEACKNGLDARIFHSLEEARAWLGR